MLIELASNVFKEHNKTRQPIKFNNGLNVIQGTTTGSNSIGKSSALLAIDFAFGGNSYLKSDGVRYLGDHTIYFCFEFDKKYYFARNTGNPDNIIICTNQYQETDEILGKNDFSSFLLEKYKGNKTNLSFRQLITTFFRIYGKDNRDENYPLQAHRGQKTKEAIKVIMSLFNYYKDVEPYHERFDLETDKLKTFTNARKYSFVSNLVGGKTKFEENIKQIENLKAELESLTESTDINATQEEIEEFKIKENLKTTKFFLETTLERLQKKLKLLDISIEYGVIPTEADLQSLAEFFPTVNVKKIYEVENYHKKLSRILNNEFENERKHLISEINEINTQIDTIIMQLSTFKTKNSLSKDFLDKHSELQKNISLLEEQNRAFVEENELRDSKSKAKDLLENNVKNILTEITFSLNSKMQELNNILYKEKRQSPKINLKNYNSYEFFTPKDTGTGTNFKGLILLDLSILYLSSLPALAHDSLLFKNIDDEGVDGIMKIYDSFSNSKKQIFIAFDKQSSYTKETFEILQKNKVLQLSSNGNELYGKSWNREVENEN